jgi:pentapeptide MXKDX repeat protein
MNILTRRIVLSVFVLATGLAGVNMALAMDPMKPMNKADCMKKAKMEKDTTKMNAMVKECDTMAMKKDTMKPMKKDAMAPDAMAAPKKK